MRRAFGRVAPRVLVPKQFPNRTRALGCYQLLEGEKPMTVIGITEVGITGCLRCRDLRSQRLSPFCPSEQTSLMQGECHRKGLASQGSRNVGPLSSRGWPSRVVVASLMGGAPDTTPMHRSIRIDLVCWRRPTARAR